MHFIRTPAGVHVNFVVIYAHDWFVGVNVIVMCILWLNKPFWEFDNIYMYVDDFGTIFQCEVNSDGDYIIWRELCDSNTIWGLFCTVFQWWWWLYHLECHVTKIWYGAYFAPFFDTNSVVMVIMSSRVSCDKNIIWAHFAPFFNGNSIVMVIISSRVSYDKNMI